MQSLIARSVATKVLRINIDEQNESQSGLYVTFYSVGNFYWIDNEAVGYTPWTKPNGAENYLHHQIDYSIGT